MAQLTRRELLTDAMAAGGILLAAPWGPGTLAAPVDETPAGQPRHRMKIDLSCIHLHIQADQLEAIELAHQHGFDSVAPDPASLSELSDSQLRQLQEDMQRYNLAWGAADLPRQFRADDAYTQEGLQELQRVARLLQSVGATRIGTWLTPFHDTLTYTENFRRTARRYRMAAGILGDHGLRLGLEYVGPKTAWTRQRHPFIHTLAETKELLAEINVESASLILDSWHWYCAGETADDILALRGEEIVVVDLNDAPAGIPPEQQVDSRRELPATTGVIDVAAFLKALRAIGYAGPVRPEPFNPTLSRMNRDAAVAATAEAMKRAFALID